MNGPQSTDLDERHRLAWLNPELQARLQQVETPAFVIDCQKIEKNCEILRRVQDASSAKILLALKGFAAWSCFDLIRRYLVGTAASGAAEARLGAEEFGGEVHTYAPAFSERDLEQCLNYSDHIIFNSFSEWRRHRQRALEAQRRSGLQFGLRINPEHSEVSVPLYDPCRPGSRLGITRAQFEAEQHASDQLQGISGLHFHTLCELGADALERTLRAVERQWSDVLPKMQWVNFGGGHHITRAGYDTELLVRIVREFAEKYQVQVYLEPGEAIALDAGVLVASVLDVTRNDAACAILDVSATAHMPDVLEMPYRPEILLLDEARSPESRPALAGDAGALGHDYVLGGPTCLAGDVMGSYSFARPLSPGARLVFRDMAIYTMVKTTMFNGVRHPDIVLRGSDGQLRVVRRFGYEDYRGRLS